MRTVFIVGKYDAAMPNGPDAVMGELARALAEIPGADVRCLFLSSGRKLAYLLTTLRAIHAEPDAVVNVHSSSFLLPAVLCACAGLLGKERFVYTVHGLNLMDSPCRGTRKRRTLYDRIEARLLRSYPKLICGSALTKGVIVRRFGRKPEDIAVLRNGIHADTARGAVRTRPSSLPCEVISVGGLSRNKGIDACLTLAQALRKRGVDARMSIYGSADAARLAWFEEYVARNGLSEYVTYAGAVTDRAEMYAIIANADVQLCLSVFDSYNTAVSESLALGCPCVCSTGCGAAGAAETDGLLVVDTSGDAWVDEACGYIARIAHDEPFAAAIRAKSGEFASYFSWEAVAKDYARILNL